MWIYFWRDFIFSTIIGFILLFTTWKVSTFTFVVQQLVFTCMNLNIGANTDITEEFRKLDLSPEELKVYNSLDIETRAVYLDTVRKREKKLKESQQETKKAQEQLKLQLARKGGTVYFLSNPISTF